jgi:hypothetical protein
MAEKKLDLVEFSASEVAQSGTRPPEVMRR